MKLTVAFGARSLSLALGFAGNLADAYYAY